MLRSARTLGVLIPKATEGGMKTKVFYSHRTISDFFVFRTSGFDHISILGQHGRFMSEKSEKTYCARYKQVPNVFVNQEA